MEDESKFYLQNTLWLVLLTLGQLVVLNSNLPYAGRVALLLAFALTEMLIVALNSMHLRYETKALKIAMFVPIPLALYFTIALIYDMPFKWFY